MSEVTPTDIKPLEIVTPVKRRERIMPYTPMPGVSDPTARTFSSINFSSINKKPVETPSQPIKVEKSFNSRCFTS